MGRSALQMTDLGFGRRLAMAREAAGLLQGAAADRLGVSRDSLSAWEQAEKNGATDDDDRYPNARVLRRICELYGVSADWLLWGEDTRR